MEPEAQRGEWLDWHRAYAEGGPLSRRLVVVRRAIREALDGHPSGPIRVLSLCAGDGRDLLGVLADHPRAGEVRAVLVELDPTLAAAAASAAESLARGDVRVLRSDAGLPDGYAPAAPADLLLVCGVFGNITDADVERTVRCLPQLCAARATVVWTRGRFLPDLTPTIRSWFAECGFEEVSFEPLPDSTAAVGVARLVGPPQPLQPGLRLFTFLPYDERPSRRAPPA